METTEVAAAPPSSAGLIAGIVIGAIALIVAIVLAVIYTQPELLFPAGSASSVPMCNVPDTLPQEAVIYTMGPVRVPEWRLTWDGTSVFKFVTPSGSTKPGLYSFKFFVLPGTCIQGDGSVLYQIQNMDTLKFLSCQGGNSLSLVEFNSADEFQQWHVLFLTTFDQYAIYNNKIQRAIALQTTDSGVPLQFPILRPFNWASDFKQRFNILLRTTVGGPCD